MQQRFLIYGLIDPRTLLIRYVGLSSSGLRRPKDHRRRTCPDTYCRRWVKSLQRLGLDYEITVLETVQDATELTEAESWWIEYGRASGWPLTNCMDGGAAGIEVVLERQRRAAERKAMKAAERQQREAKWATAAKERSGISTYSPEEIEELARIRRECCGIPAEIERQCLQFFDDHAKQLHESALIDTARAQLCVTRGTVTDLHAKWLSLKFTPAPAPKKIVNLKSLCAELFEQGKQVAEVIVELQVSPATAFKHYKQWIQISHERGGSALAEDRRALYERLKDHGSQAAFSEVRISNNK